MNTFELTIHNKHEGYWPVVVREQAGAAALTLWANGVFDLDLKQLDLLLPADNQYGTLLGKNLFRDEVRDAFARAMAEAKTANESLRVLLIVEADDLRGLHWEQLCAPLDRGWDYLLLNQGTPFSLYLPSQIERRFPPIGHRDLRALILVAGPEELSGDYGLDSFDVAATTQSIQNALGDIPYDVLASVGGASGQPTLNALCEHLTAGRHTLLHIVCHGVYQKGSGETILYFPQDESKGPIPATELIERLSRLDRLPYFTFLSTCESADPQAEVGLGGLGQRLVRDLGMPAVLAMTDRVSIATAEALASAFYVRLREHGEVDCALSEALAGLQGRYDVTVPALFSRLGGRPLFSDVLDRSLTEAEIRFGLEQLRDQVTRRAPILRSDFDRPAKTIESGLGADPKSLSPEARREQEAALEALNQLCSEALDLSFNALALGQKAPDYDARCPFRGLYPFRAEDREFFFGRKALVDKLASRLIEHSFLAVLGPSGCGKSSLVLAGLAPALEARCPVLKMAYIQPGSEPLAQLEAALANARRGSDEPHLVVVDQFEELFTLCRAENQRQGFIEHMLALARTHEVVVTMRADFWGECAAYPALRDEMQAHQELVGPMNAAELREAMEKQADHVRLRFEVGLSEDVLEDVQGEPGAMPLLQHALLLLWNRRHGRWLRWEEYLAIGGIKQAIAHTADEVYAGLAAYEKERMRDIFVRLTRLEDEQSQGEVRDTRRRVGLAELVPAGSDPDATVALVKRLADARLVVTGVNAASGQEEVEVAHEALIRHWPRLRGWLDEDRAGLRLREGLREAALEWEAYQRDDTYLVHRGGRLEDAEESSKQPRFVLNELEQAYLRACVDLRDRDRREREEQQRRELEAAQKLAEEQRARAEEQELASASMAKRARIAIGIGIVALLLAVAAGYLGWRSEQNAQEAREAQGIAEAASSRAIEQQKEAERQAGIAAAREAEARDAEATAEAEKSIALSRELAARAVEQMPLDAELGRLLALEAAAIAETDEAERALRQGILNPLTIVLRGHTQGVNSATFSPDGKWAVTASLDQTVRMWDTATWKAEKVLEAYVGMSANETFSSDGRVLVIDGPGGTGTRVAWDTTTWQKVPIPDEMVEEPVPAGLPLGPGEKVVASSQDGSLALTADGGKAQIWETETGKVLSQLGGDTPSGEELRQLGDDDQKVASAAFSPDGQLLITRKQLDNTAALWETATGRLVNTLPRHTGWILDVAFSPNSRLVATAAGYPDNTTRVWDVIPVQTQAGTQIVAELRGHASWINTVRFSPDGKLLITSSDDNTARIWELPPGAEPIWRLPDDNEATRKSAAFSSDSKVVVIDTTRGRVAWDTTTGEEVLVPPEMVEEPSLPDLPLNSGERVWVSSQDGRFALTVDDNGTGRIRDVQTGDIVAKLDGVVAASPGINARVETSAAFSRDGTLLVKVEGYDARVWEVSTGHIVANLTGRHTIVIMTVAFSPDGKFIVTGGWDNTAKVWEIATERVVADLLGHVDKVYQATFSPDGRFVLTASGDHTARLWDAKTGQSLIVFRGHKSDVREARFSPDGKLIVTGSEDGTVQVFTCEVCGGIKELVPLARARVFRKLTCEERQRFLHEEVACN